PGNKVLRLTASAATEHMHNHACTSLKDGDTFANISSSREYRISFRAKWLNGSPRLHTRLYINRLARQTVLPHPATGGTPGAENAQRVPNAGPAFAEMSHWPVVPAPGAAAGVQVRVSDPDGVQSVSLFTSVDDGPFTSVPAAPEAGGVWGAAIPGQAA